MAKAQVKVKGGKTLAPAKRGPDEREKREGDGATGRIIAAREARAETRSALPRITAEWEGDGVRMGPPHDDTNRWTAQLVEALGAVDPLAGDFLLNSAINAGFCANKPTDQRSAAALARATEGALSFVSDMQPNNPLEAALLLQMAASHHASMTISRHAARADDRHALADFSRMQNATMRTFAAQSEAFHKLRSGGKQVHEVRYVYVDARTQTVVNTVPGSGGGIETRTQSHAPARAFGYAPPASLPMRSADAGRDALPVASGEGPETVPDARRD